MFFYIKDKFFFIIDDSWERRKLSFLVKDTYNVYDNLYIIGRLASLGGMTTPKEMKKISIFCPFEKGFQTYWHFEALVPVFDTTKSKLVFNYLTMNKECKCWELVGNETSVKITTEDEDFGRHSWENCSSSNESLCQNKGKLKKNSKNIKKFHSDYLLKLEKNEFQVIQDVQELLADHGHNYQLNEFLFAGIFFFGLILNKTFLFKKRTIFPRKPQKSYKSRECEKNLSVHKLKKSQHRRRNQRNYESPLLSATKH